jgi:hypothetical protein
MTNVVDFLRPVTVKVFSKNRMSLLLNEDDHNGFKRLSCSWVLLWF